MSYNLKWTIEVGYLETNIYRHNFHYLNFS
jgi:hypothetical protein